MTSPIRLDYAARALRDLRFILQYTEDTWGSDQEEVYRQILQNAFERIRTFPEIGHPAEGRPPNIREYHLRHHVIQYRREADRVVILRIVNPRRGRR